MANELRRPITDLGLPSYLETVLAQHGMKTVGNIVKFSEEELRAMHGLGGMSIRRIRMALADQGFTLGQATSPRYRAGSKAPSNRKPADAPSRQPRQAVRGRPAP